MYTELFSFQRSIFLSLSCRMIISLVAGGLCEEPSASVSILTTLAPTWSIIHKHRVKIQVYRKIPIVPQRSDIHCYVLSLKFFFPGLYHTFGLLLGFTSLIGKSFNDYFIRGLFFSMVSVKQFWAPC